MLKRLLHRSSILQMMMLGFLVLVFIPVVCMSVWLMVYTYGYMEERQVQDDLNAVRLVCSSIEGAMTKVAGLSDTVVSNEDMVNFLGRNYNVSQVRSFEKYNREVKQVVEQAALYNLPYLLKFGVFMNNESIPEGYGVFHRLERVQGQQWYTQFMKSDERRAWARVDMDLYYQHFVAVQTQEKNYGYIYAQKIRGFQGEFLGILVTEVPQNMLFDAYELPNLFILNESTQEYMFNPSQVKLSHVLREKLKDVGRGAIREQGVSYTGEALPALDLRIGVARPIASTWEVTTKSIGFYIAIAFVMIVFLVLFLILFSYLLQFLSRGVRNVEMAVQGGEPKLLPDWGDNEIGQLARQFNYLIVRVQLLMREQVARETAQKDAQIREMQYLISPHFFYNTLDMLGSAMLMTGQVEIADSITEFGGMLRYSFKTGSLSTVRQEVRYIQSYVRLQRIKYKERIKLDVQMDDVVADTPCIKFILQPIVENAIVHGLKHDGQILHIIVRVCAVSDARVEMQVIDNGVGIAPSTLEKLRALLCLRRQIEGSMEKSSGMGLLNVHQRLILHYGEKYGLRMESTQGECTCVTLPIVVIERRAQDA